MFLTMKKYGIGVLSMKKWLFLLLCCTFSLAACSKGTVTERETEIITLFQKNCAGCHGLELNGTGLASGIRGLKKEDILRSIEQGEPNMPANILTGENAEKVANWVSKQK